MSLLGFIKFFSDIMDLIKGFQSTPSDKHDELRKEISEAFKKAKESKSPDSIVDLLNKR